MFLNRDSKRKMKEADMECLQIIADVCSNLDKIRTGVSGKFGIVLSTKNSEIQK